MATGNDQYAEFNKFQSLFYTDIDGFNRYTDFEIRKHSFALLVNMGKGFPHKADKYLNLYSPDVKGIHSPSIMRALQRSFVNNFSTARIPQYIYYKTLTPKKDPKDKKSKAKAKVETVKGFEFDDIVNFEIKRILMMDNKTFEYLKFSDKVQRIGIQLTKQ